MHEDVTYMEKMCVLWTNHKVRRNNQSVKKNKTQETPYSTLHKTKI